MKLCISIISQKCLQHKMLIVYTNSHAKVGESQSIASFAMNTNLLKF